MGRRGEGEVRYDGGGGGRQGFIGDFFLGAGAVTRETTESLNIYFFSWGGTFGGGGNIPWSPPPQIKPCGGRSYILRGGKVRTYLFSLTDFVQVNQIPQSFKFTL